MRLISSLLIGALMWIPNLMFALLCGADEQSAPYWATVFSIILALRWFSRTDYWGSKTKKDSNR